MLEEGVQQLNIEQIFKEKNPGLLKLIPGFIMRYIKRVVHEKDMNSILAKSKGIYGIDFATHIVNEIGIKVSILGLENVPNEGPVILAANHPLGGMDAMAMISFIGKKRKDIKFIVNDILTKLTNFGAVFVPVNKLGANTKQHLEFLNQVYASDNLVMIFPAGLCSRKINGVVQDIEWNKNFVVNALKYQHPIIPMLVIAKNSNWFYNTARFRTKLGIKANIEMFYLVDEMFKQKGKSIKLIIGKPILPSLLVNEKNPKQWANIIREFVYSLEKEPDGDFAEYVQKFGDK